MAEREQPDGKGDTNMKRNPIILRGPSILLIVGGLLFLAAAKSTLQAHLLRQQVDPAIPLNIIGLAMLCLVLVGLGSFLLGMSQGRKRTD